MVQNRCPALNSCKRQCSNTNDTEMDDHDRLSELPQDVQLAILSFLTTKEAARTSLVSHKWNYLWRCFPILNLDGYEAMEKIRDNGELIHFERSKFVSWVTHVLGAYLAPSVDYLTITFDLHNQYRTVIDKWVAFALAKAKKFELNFQATWPERVSEKKVYSWPALVRKSAPVNSSLTSLRLHSINITAEAIHGVLLSCPFLETLCIVRCAQLTHFRSSSLQLKHFEVAWCPRLQTIDISAPKLLSFVCHSLNIKLDIRNASLLSKVSIGSTGNKSDIMAFAFDTLSTYFPQLVYLCLHIRLFDEMHTEINCGISNTPTMTNLKHLEFLVIARCDQTLLGWTSVIGASPVLEKLTIKLVMILTPEPRFPTHIAKRDVRPLKGLKTLELRGFVGLKIDLELATYVLENATILEDVLVELVPSVFKSLPCKDAESRLGKLEKILPQEVKLTSSVGPRTDFRKGQSSSVSQSVCGKTSESHQVRLARALLELGYY